MFRNAMYLNVFITLIISIFLLIRAVKKKNALKELKYTIIIYLVFNIINLCVLNSDIVDIGWNAIFILPITLVSIIMNIVSLVKIHINNKESNDTDCNELNIKKIIIVTIIPAIIFIVPYFYELNLLNNCNYILHYNYQEGIVNSEDTYIAIVNNKPVPITLLQNISDREGQSTEELHYNINYNNGIGITANDPINDKTIEESIRKIASDAQQKCTSAKGATVSYFPEGKYAIIDFISDEDSGTVLGTYCYYDNTCMQITLTYGDLESVVYYD